MQLKDLAPVLRSVTGGMQMAAVYDLDTAKDLADGCSVDYAVKHFGDYVLDRITAYGDYLVLTVRSAETRETTDDADCWFGRVRWHDDDLRQALIGRGYTPTDENVARIRKECERGWFTDGMIEAGWTAIDYAISTLAHELT